MVEKYIETLPFTASVFVVALTIVAVLVAVFLLFMRLLDDHPIVFVIVMVVITFLDSISCSHWEEWHDVQQGFNGVGRRSGDA